MDLWVDNRVLEEHTVPIFRRFYFELLTPNFIKICLLASGMNHVIEKTDITPLCVILFVHVECKKDVAFKSRRFCLLLSSFNSAFPATFIMRSRIEITL